MSEHTKEPWTLSAAETCILDSSGRSVCRMFEGQRERARRIVACVNACAGLSTEALESGALRELIDAVERTPADLLFGPTRRAWAKLEGK